MTKKARIIGTGVYLPKKILTNADLEKMVETSDEWIVTRTGMKERRIASSEEHTSTMGALAANEALIAASLSAKDLDLILCATITPDYPFPSTAALIQAELGISDITCMDLQAACSGYLYALEVAKAFIESGVYRKILIVASEKLSVITDYTDRTTCVLFGDGAAACIVSDQGHGLFIEALSLGCDGSQAKLLYQAGGGSRAPASTETLAQKKHFISMEGKEVFKHAVRRMAAAAHETLAKAGLHGEQIAWFVPHQANLRIIEALAKRFNISMDKVYMTIHKYGNTSASSVGIALDELLKEKKIYSGDHILLTAFGAGLTWASCLLTWRER